MSINLPASVAIKASVSGQSAVDQLKASVSGIKSDTGGLAAGFNTVTNSLKALAGAYVIQQGISFLKNIVDTAATMTELSQKVNLSVESLTGLKTAGELSGVSFEEMQKSLVKFNVAVADAGAGNDKAKAGFGLLGISVRDANGNLKSNDVLLDEVANKFQSLADSQTKTKAATLLFSKSGADLIPVLNQGADSLHKYGLAIDDAFGDRAHELNDTLTLLKVQAQNFAIEGLKALLPVLQDVGNALLDLKSDSKDTVGVFDLIGEGIRLAAVIANDFAQAILQIIDIVKSGSTSIGGFFEAIGQSGYLALHGQFSAAADAYKEFSAQNEKADAEYLARTNARAQKSEDFYQRIAKNSLILGEGSVSDIKARTAAQTEPDERVKGTAATNDDALNKKTQEGIKFAQDKVRSINAETAALGETDEEKKKLVLAAELEQHGLQAGTAEYIKQTAAINAAVDAQEKRKKALEASASEGIKQGLKAYSDAALNVAAQTSAAVQNAFKGMEDALVDFVKTGKLSFTSLADSIITDLIRISIRSQILGPLAASLGGLFGGGAGAASGSIGSAGVSGASSGSAYTLSASSFAAGGIMTARGQLNLRKYASGGVANSPQLALFGEGRSPEAYVPLPDGRSIPVSMKGASGDVNVSVTVNVESGQESTTSDSDKGTQLGKLVSGIVKNQLIQEKRPGGLLS